MGEDKVYVSKKIGDADYEVTSHKGGNIIVIKKDRKDHFKGWSVNAKVKFGDTGVNVSAKISGKNLNPKTWKYTEALSVQIKKPGFHMVLEDIRMPREPGTVYL